nr:ribonuclease III [Anaerolineae bacterium]
MAQDINFQHFEETNRLNFTDKALLKQAFTHPSYANEQQSVQLIHNQRMEFLGDAVLDFISGELLYERYPDEAEGRLTQLRAALVRTETLARFAQECRIDQFLLLGKGEESTGGRQRISNLCDAFEAVVGALYLDQGFAAVRIFVTPLMEAALEDILRLSLEKDAKSQLQEWAQAHLDSTPTYLTVGSKGPDHAKEFTVAVVINDNIIATGVGPSKQLAAQSAALQALMHFRAESQSP